MAEDVDKDLKKDGAECASGKRSILSECLASRMNAKRAIAEEVVRLRVRADQLEMLGAFIPDALCLDHAADGVLFDMLLSYRNGRF